MAQGMLLKLLFCAHLQVIVYFFSIAQHHIPSLPAAAAVQPAQARPALGNETQKNNVCCKTLIMLHPLAF